MYGRSREWQRRPNDRSGEICYSRVLGHKGAEFTDICFCECAQHMSTLMFRRPVLSAVMCEFFADPASYYQYR